MQHPFFDAVQYPWHRSDAMFLHSQLYRSLQDPARISLLYQSSGEGLAPLPTPPAAADVIWKAALDQLAAAGRLEDFCSRVLEHGYLASVHPAVKAVQQAAGAIAQEPRDVGPYLNWIEERTSFIELPTFFSSSIRRIAIDDVFIDLRAVELASRRVLELPSSKYVSVGSANV